MSTAIVIGQACTAVWMKRTEIGIIPSGKTATKPVFCWLSLHQDGLFSPNHNPDLGLVDFALQTNLFNQDQHTYILILNLAKEVVNQVGTVHCPTALSTQ